MEQTTKHDRFEQFTEAEKIILSEALRTQTLDIAGDAAADLIAVDEREAAASTFIVGAALGLEVAGSLGQEELPTLDMFEGTASAILDGTLGEVLREERQGELVEEARRQLGESPTGTLTPEDAAA